VRVALAALIIIEEEEAFAHEGQTAQLFGQSVTEFQCRIAHRLGLVISSFWRNGCPWR
jgi:hypothetical protein